MRDSLVAKARGMLSTSANDKAARAAARKSPAHARAAAQPNIRKWLDAARPDARSAAFPLPG